MSDFAKIDLREKLEPIHLLPNQVGRELKAALITPPPQTEPASQNITNRNRLTGSVIDSVCDAIKADGQTIFTAPAGAIQKAIGDVRGIVDALQKGGQGTAPGAGSGAQELLEGPQGEKIRQIATELRRAADDALTAYLIPPPFHELGQPGKTEMPIIVERYLTSGPAKVFPLTGRDPLSIPTNYHLATRVPKGARAHLENGITNNPEAIALEFARSFAPQLQIAFIGKEVALVPGSLVGLKFYTEHNPSGAAADPETRVLISRKPNTPIPGLEDVEWVPFTPAKGDYSGIVKKPIKRFL